MVSEIWSQYLGQKVKGTQLWYQELGIINKVRRASDYEVVTSIVF